MYLSCFIIYLKFFRCYINLHKLVHFTYDGFTRIFDIWHAILTNLCKIRLQSHVCVYDSITSINKTRFAFKINRLRSNSTFFKYLFCYNGFNGSNFVVNISSVERKISTVLLHTFSRHIQNFLNLSYIVL